jgi:septum site-determining protein MinC
MALVLAPEPPVDEWVTALDAQIERSPSFFDGRPVLVDLAALPADQPDVAGLIESLRARGIRIVGTEGAHPSWQGVESWGRPLSGGSRTARPIEVPLEASAQPAPAATPAPPPPPEPASLLVDHSVRSGQSVVCERGDVIVVGSVASGAEVMAGGSIHIYGTLRGRAVAGLAGNAGARIFCRRLEAELLAIDGLYRTADAMDPGLRGRAVQAWLDGQSVRMAALD